MAGSLFYVGMYMGILWIQRMAKVAELRNKIQPLRLSGRLFL